MSKPAKTDRHRRLLRSRSNNARQRNQLNQNAISYLASSALAQAEDIQNAIDRNIDPRMYGR